MEENAAEIKEILITLNESIKDLNETIDGLTTEVYKLRKDLDIYYPDNSNFKIWLD